MSKLLLAMACLIVGTVAGEYKACSEIKGKYSWDYGTCDIGSRK